MTSEACVLCYPEHATAEPLRMKRHSRRHILFFVRSIVVVSFFPSPPPERCRLRFSSGTSSQILLAIPHRTALWLHRWFRGDPTSTSSAGPPPLIQFYFVHRPKPSTSFRLPKLPPHPHKTLRFLDGTSSRSTTTFDARRSISSCTTTSALASTGGTN
ncbi:hypothetical protein BHM03_00044163 [Ensete ventricosum]|nr:hypothetical protein BHM03_00044163 [Ensete ventricosum]